MATTVGKRRTASKRAKTSGSKKAPATKRNASKKTAGSATPKTGRGAKGQARKTLQRPPPAARASKRAAPRMEHEDVAADDGWYAFYIFALTPSDFAALGQLINSVVMGTPTPRPRMDAGIVIGMNCKDPEADPRSLPLILYNTFSARGDTPDDAAAALDLELERQIGAARLDQIKNASRNFVQYAFSPNG